MPVRPPGLDDRRFDDLVNELVARIPAHTPEWSNPRPGDPGHTLIDLFAWLTDTLLYRANLIPERQRLAFLRLLGEQMRPARPARTLISVSFEKETMTQSVVIRPQATVKGPVNFETLTELTVLPISVEAYVKRPLEPTVATEMAAVIDGLRTVYGINGQTKPYTTMPVFVGGAASATGLDIAKATESVDKCLWLALLAPKPTLVDLVHTTLGVNPSGGQQLLYVGLQPTLTVPDLFEEIGQRGRIPHLWEVPARMKSNGEIEYMALDVISDSSAGLTRRGIVQLALPAKEFLLRPENDVRLDLAAGVGDKPPRLDDPEKAARLVTWVRLRPLGDVQQLALSWIGINAVEIDQRQTMRGRVIGQSNGAGNQEFQLPGVAVDPQTLEIEVQEPEGYRRWQRVDDLALTGRDDSVFSLDAAAGTILFGDNVRGRIPGGLIRVAFLRAGGGAVGNLPPGSLTGITAVDLNGKAPPSPLKVSQPLATDGGEETETLAAAEQRIPSLFRHRDRCITADDYKRLTADTPGVRIGRVEVLPRFRPQQRQSNVLGVISVMVLPFQAALRAPNPRPDRPQLESVHSWLDERRPLGTELYVIGCEYVPLGISVGVAIGDGFGQETVLNDVREALRRFLWPLTGGGVLGAGWPLGGTVREREVEVAVARVAGVVGIRGVKLFQRHDDDWRRIPPVADNAELRLELWQLPELLSVVVVADQNAPDTLTGVPNPFAATGVAVPVAPEMCR